MQWYNYDHCFLSSIDEQSSGIEAAVKDCVAAPNRKYNNRECSKVSSRYDLRLPLAIVTTGTFLDDWIRSLWGERAISTNSILFRQTSQWTLINRQRADTDMFPEDGIWRRFLGTQGRWFLLCSRDSQDPCGYRMDRLGTFRRPADWAWI